MEEVKVMTAHQVEDNGQSEISRLSVVQAYSGQGSSSQSLQLKTVFWPTAREVLQRNIIIADNL